MTDPHAKPAEAPDLEEAAPSRSQAILPTVSAVPWDVQAGFYSWFNRAVQDLGDAAEPLLGLTRREATTTDPRDAVVPEAAPVQPPPSGSRARQVPGLYKPISTSHEWTVETSTILDFNEDVFIAQLDEIARSFANQLSRGMLSHLTEVTSAHGQTVDGSGRNPWDAVLEAIEKVDLTFDDEGEHGGTLVLHPDLKAKMMANPPTPEQLARAEAIVAEKRERYFASRTLEELP